MSPETHEITTIAELLDLTTEANVDEMVQNVEETLRVVAAAKASGFSVGLRSLTWVDDGKPGISKLGLNFGETSE